MFSFHTAKVLHSPRPNSRIVTKRHELASYCELSRPQTSFFSTDFFFVHRLAQIYTDFLISKDIVIITDLHHQSIINNQ